MTCRMGVSLRDLGEHRLKDLQHPATSFNSSLQAYLPTSHRSRPSIDIPNNLPIQPTPLIGREKEVAAPLQLPAA